MNTEIKPSDKNRIPHSIQYMEFERIPIRFWSLIIHLPSLNRDIGLLRDFAARYPDMGGVTNGRIWLMAEMTSPPFWLYQIIDEFLKPNGMCQDLDYTLVFEQNLTREHEQTPNILNKPIAELEHVPWLGSWIDANGEQWVWWKKIEYIPF